MGEVDPDATAATYDGGVPIPAAPWVPALGDRYEDLGRIGAGGFAEVRRVRDRVLARTVAMKLLPAGDPARVRAVEREAQLTARLQHPGIVAVHDMGTLPDGRVWFTMREVNGRTLSEVLRSFHAARRPREWGTTADGWNLRRLVGTLEAIARVVAYAHSEGVAHRDLKPDNVMIGRFGEVQLLDWGIAGELGASAGGTGTPAYMAPEQALGTRIGPAADVWALGAVLYRLLCGAPPYVGADAGAVREALRAGPPPPVHERTGPDDPPLPPDLVEVCGRATAREPEARPTADEVADALRAWLDGTRDAARARALAEGADDELARARELREQAAGLRLRAEAALAGVAPSDPVAAKRPSWELLDAAQVAVTEAELAEVRFVQAQRGALELVADLDAAHRRLATHYRDRLAAAERDGRTPEATRYEALLREHDRGEHAAWLAGTATLELATDPPGARVVAEPIEAVDRRWVAGAGRELGATPLVATLPHGRWRLRLSAPGCAEVLYPVLLERAGRWSRVPPGGDRPEPVWLPPADELGPDDRYVPAGWFRCGGDPEAPDSLPARSLWVDGFVIRAFPVTFAEYLVFLGDLAARGEAIDPLVPRGEAGAPPRPVSEGAALALGAIDGRPVHPDEPVTLIDWWAARAYAAWLAERDGRPWRLPHDLEWEKAARGVDGRVFPFGPFLDPTFARMQQSSAGAPGPVPVTGHPEDTSPYEVRGLGGNVRDWCGNGYRRHGPEGDRVVPVDGDDDEPLRVVRGGSWHSGPLFCRAAGRLVGPTDTRRQVFGFRVARSAGPRGRASTCR